MSRPLSSILFSLPALATGVLLIGFFALFQGAYDLGSVEVLKTLFAKEVGSKQFLLLHIRLPRILLAATTGAGLAISGAAIQGLFRNPLADHTLIGVTSGAMLAAVIAIVLMGSALVAFSEIFRQATVAIFAFCGGLGTTYLVYLLSRRQGQTSVMTMLLAGIAISAFAAAIAGVFMYLSDDQQLRDITCLLYTSPSPRDRTRTRMPSSA